MTNSEPRKYRLNIIAEPVLIFLVIISSCFLLNRGLRIGHDLEFFIYRLKGVADSLSAGEVLGRIQTSQINGYGYPVGVMYCNLFYYPAAILHLLGLSLDNCYRFVVLTVNLVTVFVGTYSFTKICGSRKLGLFATWLFTLSYYRIEDITLRSDIGEAFGMAFMPLVAMSFCLVLSGGRNLRGGEEKTLLPPWMLFGLSMAGVGASNVPLTLICALFLFLMYCLALALFPPTRSVILFTSLLKGTLLCLLLLSFYIVPLFDYYLNAELATTSGVVYQGTSEAAANYAVSFSQLFAPLKSMSGWADTLTMPTTTGLALLIGPIVHALIKIKNSSRRLSASLLILTALALVMCTTLFPWDTEIPFLKSLVSLIAKIQFPWRFLSMACLLLAIISALSIDEIHVQHPGLYPVLMAGILAISTIEALYGITSWQYGTGNTNTTEILSTNEGAADKIFVPARAYGNDGIDYSIDYPISGSSKIEISSYEKSGTTMTLEVEADGSGTVALPAYNYLHYAARSSNDDVTVGISTDDQGRITLDVSGSSAATVTVWFDEPAAWRASEFVSLAAACAVILYAARGKLRAASPDDKTDRLERA